MRNRNSGSISSSINSRSTESDSNYTDQPFCTIENNPRAHEDEDEQLPLEIVLPATELARTMMHPAPPMDDNQSIITELSMDEVLRIASMDEELRLALEISKRDTGNHGNHHPPRPTPPVPRPVPRTQDNLGRDAMNHDAPNDSSLADLLLALKLSVEESGLDRRAPTNLDELIAFEMSQDSRQHMTDFVAAAGAMDNSNSNSSPRPPHKPPNLVNSIDSEGRRQQLLERGTSETKSTIESRQAHVVTCLGCGGRLQAPMSYSLVYCPRCHTISPA